MYNYFSYVGDIVNKKKM